MGLTRIGDDRSSLFSLSNLQRIRSRPRPQHDSPIVLARIIHERDRRGLKAEGRGATFRTLQPSVFSLEIVSSVTLFPPVSRVSLESGIGDCSRSFMNNAG